MNIILLFYTILDDLPKTKKYAQEEQESNVRGISLQIHVCRFELTNDNT